VFCVVFEKEFQELSPKRHEQGLESETVRMLVVCGSHLDPLDSEDGYSTRNCVSIVATESVVFSVSYRYPWERNLETAFGSIGWGDSQTLNTV